MEPKVHYVIVGTFILFLGMVAIAMVLWLGKSDYRGVYERYYAYMRQSVSGLSVNSTVKYRGVDVGRVKDIALNPDNAEEVRVTLDILEGTPIKTDTVATLETQGLTGLATLNLEGGSQEAPELRAQPGQLYPVIQTKPSLFYRLDMALSKLLSEEGVSKLLVNLNAFSENANALINEGSRQKIKRLVQDLSDFSRVLAGERREIRRTIDTASEAMDNFARLTSHLNQDLPALLERLQGGATKVEQVTDELAKTGKMVRGIVQENRPDVERFARETLGETALLIGELRQLASTLQRVAQNLEREPESLMFGRPVAPRGPGE